MKKGKKSARSHGVERGERIADELRNASLPIRVTLMACLKILDRAAGYAVSRAELDRWLVSGIIPPLVGNEPDADDPGNNPIRWGPWE